MRPLILMSALAACTEPPITSAIGRTAFTAPHGDVHATHEPRYEVVILGQSNAGNQGLVAELAPDESQYGQPYTSALYQATLGSNTGTSEALFPYELGTIGPLDNVIGENSFGIEATMARDLDQAFPGRIVVAKYSVGDTSLAGSWKPTGVWPSATENLFSAAMDLANEVAGKTDAQIVAIVWIQGEADASGTVISKAAQQYGSNLGAFVGDVRTALGVGDDVPFIYGRINTLFPGAGTADVRAGEEACQGAHEIMVDQDPYPMRSGHVHYTTEGVIGLGHAYATAVLSATH